MANTLSEYEDLINDPVKVGIAHTILVADPLLQVLPFKGITSNTIKYKMETAEADARFYEVGEEWVEGAPTWEDRYDDLAILGGRYRHNRHRCYQQLPWLQDGVHLLWCR